MINDKHTEGLGYCFYGGYEQTNANSIYLIVCIAAPRLRRLFWPISVSVHDGLANQHPVKLLSHGWVVQTPRE